MEPTKVALVTASSAGLGAATAKGLACVGFSTAINYNSNQHKAEELVSSINQIYGQRHGISSDGYDLPHCIAIQADMSQKSNIQQLVQQVIDHYGRLDCVVSNQGWTAMRRFEDLDDNMEEEDWNHCYDMNVKSHLFLFHAARPHLARSKGSFTTIASLAGVIPSGSSIVCLSMAEFSRMANSNSKPYSVSKAAQIHLVKTLAKVAAPDIVVNSISPGILLTVSQTLFNRSKLNELRHLVTRNGARNSLKRSLKVLHRRAS